MIHSLNKKNKKKEQQNKQKNRQQIKIARISYPKLLFWRLLSQQFGRAKRQQYLGSEEFFFGVRRIFLLILTFIHAFRVFSLLSLAIALVGILRNFQGSRRGLVSH